MSAEDTLMAAEDTCTDAPGAGSAPGFGDPTNGLEALSCVSCRARKLKCCRSKPACTRCIRVKAECVYPESRRKPAFKRRNVKELEQRLAQVEVLLKDATGNQTPAGGEAGTRDGDTVHEYPPGLQAADSEKSVAPDTGYLASDDSHVPTDPMSWNYNNAKPSNDQGMPFSMPDMKFKPRTENVGATNWELLGMGLFEALPPTEMIEELHQAYFTRQHGLIPIIQPTRYIQAFYSAPHLRPPMALQYAVWTMASLGHEKYMPYHDVFHRRCRHYLEEDELRGDGEHFLTVAHAQAWALMATAEARNMWFTRAAMSAARCIKLLHMLGLHKLDDPNAQFELAPTILPPKDWTELEERRRVFWGAFAIDSHASISTGWPCLIDPDDVTTHLPSSEEAFNQCREETTCRLDEVFTGSQYSSFAGAAVVCHLFNQIMKHVHHTRRDDNPQNYEYGKYWNRHRRLDNLVSSAFMYLPELFRLPKNLKDPVAVHTNLNLHAATICLHNRAYEMAIEHALPEQIKMTSKTRLETTAQEIVNIVKLTSHSNTGYRSPLVALALYVASSVYISVKAEDGLKPADTADLEFLLLAMEAVGKQHVITRSFLGQAVEDVDRAGLTGRVRIPKVAARPPMRDDGTTPPPCGANIPVFARSRISKHNKINPPLPGRLPLNNPIGRDLRKETREVVFHPLNPWTKGSVQIPSFRGEESANKRKRVDLSPEPSGSSLPTQQQTSNNPSLNWTRLQPDSLVEEISSSDNTPSASGPSAGSRANSGSCGVGEISMDTAATRGTQYHYQYNLPHRAGSSTTGSSPSAVLNSSSTPSSSDISPGLATRQTTSGTLRSVGDNSITITAGMFDASGLHQTNSVDLNMFQGFQGWDVTTAADGSSGSGSANDGLRSYSQQQQAAGGLQNGGFIAGLDDESWMILNDSTVLNGGTSWEL